MRTKLLVLANALVSVAAAPLGCGSLDGHTGTPGTLATVQGGLVNPSGYSVQNDVRVAVVWRNLDNSRPQIEYIVSQDLPVRPVFPSSFVVQLDGPPPAAALHVQEGYDFPVGEGVVVAYEDLNGNGKLDLVPDDAGAFIDQIVGANEDMALIYIGGPIPPQLAQNQQNIIGTPMSGYNIVRAPKVTCGGSTGSGGSSSGAGSNAMGGSNGSSSGAASSSGADSNSGAGSGSSGGAGSAAPAEAGAPADPGLMASDGGPCVIPPAEWLPMTTTYDLTVSSDPQVNQIMCQNGGWGGAPSSSTCSGPPEGAASSSGASSDASGSASSSDPSPPCAHAWDVGTQGPPPGGYPSPGDPGLTCIGANVFIFQQCVTVQQICEATPVTNCTGIGTVVLGSASRPPDWPCP